MAGREITDGDSREIDEMDRRYGQQHYDPVGDAAPEENDATESGMSDSVLNNGTGDDQERGREVGIPVVRQLSRVQSQRDCRHLAMQEQCQIRSGGIGYHR